MDKTEYRIKLDEINRMVEAQDYEGALTLADSVDWRRVKSVRTLCMVADIYEVNGELDESMKMLQLAYKRSSVGKMILYRQVELSLKMGDYDGAVKYYNRYLETASNDTSKYILKYKIYKAQNAPLDDQIAILEEYKDREYTERWVYELARLYKKAGRQNKCVETCDDLILWFGDGKYVTKAMELKMTYVPLTAAQKIKYDQREQDEETVVKQPREKVTAATVAGISAAAMASLQKASVIPQASLSESVKTTGMEEAAVSVEPELKPEEKKSTPVDEIPQIHVDTAQLQEKLAKSFQEVLSGFNRTKVVNAFEALGRATNSEVPQETAEENIEEYQVADLEPETVNETKISADKGEAIAQKTEAPEVIPEEVKEEVKSEDKEITSIQDMDLDALFAETSSVFAEEIAGNADQTEPELLITEPVLGDTQDISLEDEVLAAIGEQEQPEAEPEEPAGTSEEENLDFLPEIDLDIVMELQKEKEEADAVTEAAEDETAEAEPEEPEQGQPEMEETEPEESEMKEMEPEIDHVEMMLTEAETEPEIPSVVMEKETPEEKRIRILSDTRPERLTDHQKSLFSYFSKVPGMDEQILEAINGVYQHADEKTSRRGNIAIMGSHGTGKTRLSEGLVRAICKELGLEAVKYANLDASDMNRKDPAAVIGKMAGGFLLIERASYMTAETIGKLSRAMDFRTDSMILLIEDDKANMRKLLADYPEFAEKFETVISIPVFTNDELVTFARTYAKENGYRMDEMGVLALYTLIGDNQREDEPITIGKVKDMVDGAIRKAGGARLGRRLSKRHTDADGRILLYEKDFDI